MGALIFYAVDCICAEIFSISNKLCIYSQQNYPNNYYNMKPSTFFAFLGGVLAGATIAMLFTPETGSETRKKIKETILKEVENINSKLSDNGK